MRLAGTLLSTLLAACAAHADASIVHRAGEPDVYRMPATDARMNEAIALARHSVEEFIGAFTHATAHQRSFAVEVSVIDGTSVEQLWVDLESYANGQFTGHIANEPLDVHNVQRGDRIVVDQERISDWMYVDRGHLVGGFTLRLMRATLNEADRQAFDATLPFEVTD